MQYILDGMKRNASGIFCLCENGKSIAMHADYANGFRGICIGFDWRHFNLNVQGSSDVLYRISEDKFNDSIVERGQIKWCFCEATRAICCKFVNRNGVQDTKSLLIDNEVKNNEEKIMEEKILNEINDLLHLNGSPSYVPIKQEPRQVIYESVPPTIVNHPKDWRKVFTTKSMDFKREEEWRLFFHPGKWKDHSIRAAIKEIIFGYRVSKENIIKVMHLVNDIKDIKFFIARPKIGTYEVEVKSIPSLGYLDNQFHNCELRKTK